MKDLKDFESSSNAKSFRQLSPESIVKRRELTNSFKRAYTDYSQSLAKYDNASKAFTSPEMRQKLDQRARLIMGKSADAIETQLRLDVQAQALSKSLQEGYELSRKLKGLGEHTVTLEQGRTEIIPRLKEVLPPRNPTKLAKVIPLPQRGLER